MICTRRAAHIPLVPRKTIAQQDVRARELDSVWSIAARGRDVDLGLPQSEYRDRQEHYQACRSIPKILADAASELTTIARGRGDPSATFFRNLDRGIGWFDEKIDRLFIESGPCRCIPKI